MRSPTGSHGQHVVRLLVIFKAPLLNLRCAAVQKIMQDIYSASMSAAKEYDTHLQVCFMLLGSCRLCA